MAKVGTAPISWGACEIPRWGDQLPWERVLDEMVASGYSGTELGPWGYLPNDATTLGRALGTRGLTLAGAFCPVTLHRDRDAGIRQAEETARLLAALGAPVLVLADAGRETTFTERLWRQFNEGVNEVARRARALGLLTAFHPHVGSQIESSDEIGRLLAGTDSDLVGLCLDTGHVAYAGGDIVGLARAHGPRIRHVHLKDLRPDRRGGELRDAVGRGVFAPLGEGSLPLRELARALAPYEGWLIVEQDVRLGVTPGADPARDARTSRAFVRDAFGA
ncbi:MAG TPA: TIM barrel protein [Candidatus Limnocylindria bacterium]|nr:TIM barrel protein [Candidatus Limnocylindria bacterium]